jgi:hypothetical protein
VSHSRPEVVANENVLVTVKYPEILGSVPHGSVFDDGKNALEDSNRDEKHGNIATHIPEHYGLVESKQDSVRDKSKQTLKE